MAREVIDSRFGYLINFQQADRKVLLKSPQVKYANRCTAAKNRQ